MNFNKYFKHAFVAVAGVASITLLGSCADDIELAPTTDLDAYESVTRLDGMLLDRKSNKNQTILELYGNEYQTEVYFRLNKQPQKGVDVAITVDAAYLEQYNEANGTAYQLYPTDQVKLARNGELLLAPDETTSIGVGVTITAAADLEQNVTYVLPLKATSSTAGVTLTEKTERMLYFVKDMRSASDTYKGEDAVKTVLYFEVNDVNPLNALEFVLEDSGKLFFDDVVLFAANINYNAETGRVYVYNNPNVQFLLDHSEEYLQPLRKRGMRVILSILGNWDPAGVAQLSDIGARMFAQELAAICYAYNLDGVAFDDEYSASPDLDNPLFTTRSYAAGSRLLYETKKAMPDKLVTLYYLGRLTQNCPAVNGINPSEFVDYAVADYGGEAQPMLGMTRKQCSGMSIELARGYTYNATESFARGQKKNGFGYWMFFALNPNEYVSKSQVQFCRNVCKGLYEENLVEPAYYYPKNSTVRTAR